MTTDWKALCTELAKVLAEEYGVQREFDRDCFDLLEGPLLGSGAIELLSRVCTELSQPEPEPEESAKCDEDRWRKDALEKLIYAAQHFRLGAYSAEELEIFEKRGRAVLANWGRPAVEPVPEELTDEELLAVLSRAVASFPPIHPEAKALSVDEYDWELEARKARAVIAADRARWGRATVEPVPVSERPWEREGWCNNNGWCWGFDANDTDPFWEFGHPEASGCWTHVLPHYALPILATTETP